MDRFEELGLSKSATEAEISRAYKKLARLLHPDGQRDPELRELAELQMRRLNETISVLLDPKQRRKYERDIDSTSRSREVPIIVVPPLPSSTKRIGPVPVQSMWCVIGGVVLASIFWYPLTAPSAPSYNPTSAAVEFDTQQERPLGADLSKRIRDLEADVAALRLGNKSTTPGASLHRPALAGSWIYQTERGDPDSAIRSVTLQLSDDQGIVRGSYSATAGSSGTQISFQLEGRGTDSYARVPWSAANGSNGEIEMRLLRPNVLETRWWAYRASGEMPATSSTAVLRRLQIR